MKDQAIRSYLSVDDELGLELWKIFEAGMHRIERATPYKQGLRADEFFPMMRDSAFVKYVLYDHEQPAGIAVVATNVHKIEWLSGEYFDSVYGDLPVHYMIGVAVTEDQARASSLGGRALVMAALEDLPADGAFIYDFSCSIHASLSSFGQMITKETGRVRMLDAVEYWEIRHSRTNNGMQFNARRGAERRDDF